MAYWQSVSCVTFRPIDHINDYEYLMVAASAAGIGCYSNLGMIQEGSFITNIKLDTGCDSFAIAADMLSHSLGVYSTGGAITDKPSIATIAKVNEMYKCSASCSTKPACLNGGTPSGKDCASCVCPAGWSGAKCDETSAGTQLVQVADTRDVTLSLTGAFTTADEKVIIVQAPAGKKLQATIKTFGPECFTACTIAGVQISGSTTDKIICSTSPTPSDLVSTGNSLTLRLFRTANYAVQATVSLNVV
ncbi:hypothetical protein PENTCL1PPCAC_15708 [Pristionchus entomophagus]|uniref:EGF-like domain-containing protein n=1 Tax=Pristionchus entomophagus TaxID=358040 RepID=A0AAV5TFP1_9BILA|nr:hypothetical protein PENTCL1PPCAC_15708 [Pristionchus entomophagus]